MKRVRAIALFLVFSITSISFFSTAYASEKDQLRRINEERQHELDSLQEMSNKLSGESKARTLLKLSRLYREYDYEKSKEKALEAYEVTKDINSVEGQQIALNFLGLNEKFHGHYDVYLAHTKQSLVLSKSLANPCKISISLAELAEALKEIGQVDSAIYYYQMVINDQSCGEMRATVNNGVAHFNLANIYKDRRDYQAAIDLFSTASQLSIAAGRGDVHGAALREYGSVAMIMGQYSKAIPFIFKGLEKLKETRDVLNIGVAYGQLGELYSLMKTSDSLVSYYFRRGAHYMSILDRKEAKFLRYQMFLGLSRHFYEVDKRDSSIKYAQKILDLLKTRPDTTGSPEMSRILGGAYLYSGQLERSAGEWNKILTGQDSAADVKLEIIGHLNLGLTLFDMKRYDAWESELQKAYEFTKPVEFRSMRHLLQLDLVFSKRYEKLGMYELSIEYLKRYKRTSDSLNFHESRAKVSAFHELIDARIKLEGQEDKLVQLLNEKKRLELKGTIVIWISFFLVALSVLTFFFLRQRGRLRKLKAVHLEKGAQNELNVALGKVDFLSKDLKSKTLELTTTSLKVLQRDELLQSLEDDLEKLAQKEAVSPTEIGKLKKQISLVNLAGRSWETFAQHHDELHQGFLTKLKNAYPQLSDQDLRLLAVVRLGLSNKEIAGLLNIQPESVRKYKYRLRQKMEDDSQMSIEDILAEIDN